MDADASNSIHDSFSNHNGPHGLSEGTAGCSSTHAALAAGRAYIQRRDKSLQTALAAYDAGDYPVAIAQFKIAWDKIGYPDAALFLGHIYVLGQGTQVDIREGIKWLKRAANQPHQTIGFDPSDPGRSTPKIDAALTLGSIYLTGYGVPQDKKEAVHWYKKAANTGHVPSAVILASLYQNGIGVAQDLKKAASLYRKAAEADYGVAQYNLARLYETGQGVEQNATLALEWDTQAAKNGHAGALYEMAARYDRGKDGLSVDPDKAIIYYKEAALKNQSDAQNALGVSFYAGDGVETDQPTARKWFEQAALRGQPDAMFNLGVMLMNGEGGDTDNAMAYVWFSLAQQSGNTNAVNALKVIEPKLTAEDRTKAQNLLNPQA